MAQLGVAKNLLRLFRRHRALEILLRGIYYKYYPHALHPSSFIFHSFLCVLSHLNCLFQFYIIPHSHKLLQALPSSALTLGSGSEEQIAHLYPLHSKDKMEMYGFTERICPRVFCEKCVFSI